MQGQPLDVSLSQGFMRSILHEDANSLQTAACLALLRAKPETPDELMGMVSVLQHNMIPLHTPHRVLDIVGTGGDCRNTVNISTGSAILAASCGIKVIKHGNRAVSSMAGSADVLEAFGIAIGLPPEKIVKCLEACNIGFCFAPDFHPALRQLRALRQQLGIPTTLNLLGPLLNPARPDHVLLGVYRDELLEPMAGALQKPGTLRSMVVHGCDLDELSCAGVARVIEVTPNGMHEYCINPVALGLSPCTVLDLQGGHARDNARLLLEVFSRGNSTRHRAIADTLVLNAGVALYLYGLHASIEEGIAHAQDNLMHGAVMALLDKWVEYSND